MGPSQQGLSIGVRQIVGEDAAEGIALPIGKPFRPEKQVVKSEGGHGYAPAGSIDGSC